MACHDVPRLLVLSDSFVSRLLKRRDLHLDVRGRQVELDGHPGFTAKK
jgi:hypothetical protein